MAVIDSDTVVFPENFQTFMQNHADQYSGSIVGCTIMNGQPAIRSKDSKYYVSVKQWPDELLPQYCSGVLILINVEVAYFCLIAFKLCLITGKILAR